MRTFGSGRRITRLVTVAGPGALLAAVLVWIVARKGDEIAASLGSCPLWVIAAATLAHTVTLVLRSEAWRLTLGAVADGGVSRRTVHAANAGAFLAGTLQSHAAMPARVALILRLSPPPAPRASQVVLADAPIFVLETVLLATLMLVAAPALGIPWWAPLAVLCGALALLVALGAAHVRFAERPLAAGLAVLSRPAARGRLATLVSVLTAVALVRVWFVLVGFGLPAGPAEVALLLTSLGAIGLLPLGLGTGPASTVATFGAAGVAQATAAGLAISATTVLAVLLYAAITWAWRFARHPVAAPDPGRPDSGPPDSLQAAGAPA
jgi:hypothetical protein